MVAYQSMKLDFVFLLLLEQNLVKILTVFIEISVSLSIESAN